jgi:hypothetical protein
MTIKRQIKSKYAQQMNFIKKYNTMDLKFKRLYLVLEVKLIWDPCLKDWKIESREWNRRQFKLPENHLKIHQLRLNSKNQLFNQIKIQRKIHSKFHSIIKIVKNILFAKKSKECEI